MPIGEILSLGSAIIWGFSVSLFKIIGNTVSPYILNPVKNTIGTILFLLTCFFVGSNHFIYPLSMNEYLIIGLSGVIGITIADVLFLQSLNIPPNKLYFFLDNWYVRHEDFPVFNNVKKYLNSLGVEKVERVFTSRITDLEHGVRKYKNGEIIWGDGEIRILVKK